MDLEPSLALNAHILDQDLQIVRATLACIADDVGAISAHAGKSLQEALVKLDQAHAELLRPARFHLVVNDAIDRSSDSR